MAVRRRRSTKQDDFKVIFVSGYAGAGGPDPNYVKECWWKLHSYVKDLSVRQRGNQLNDCLCVVNKSSALSKVNGGNIRELQQMFLDMPVNGEKFTRIVFGHSHGARVVYEALKDTSLLRFLEHKRICKPDEKIKQIRAHLAVITLGGIQDIPKAFAKICWNLLFTSDGLAKTGLKRYAEKHDQEVNVKKIGTISPIVDSTVDATSNGFAFFANGASTMYDYASDCNGPLPARLVASVSTVLISIPAASVMSGKHYFDHYLTDDKMMAEVLCILGLNNDETEP